MEVPVIQRHVCCLYGCYVCCMSLFLLLSVLLLCLCSCCCLCCLFYFLFQRLCGQEDFCISSRLIRLPLMNLLNTVWFKLISYSGEALNLLKADDINNFTVNNSDATFSTLSGLRLDLAAQSVWIFLQSNKNQATVFQIYPSLCLVFTIRDKVLQY